MKEDYQTFDLLNLFIKSKRKRKGIDYCYFWKKRINNKTFRYYEGRISKRKLFLNSLPYAMRKLTKNIFRFFSENLPNISNINIKRQGMN